MNKHILCLTLSVITLLIASPIPAHADNRPPVDTSDSLRNTPQHLILRDTLRQWITDTLHDTIRYTINVYLKDTLYQHITAYDTLRKDSTVRLVNPALPTDTLIDTFYLPYIVYQPVHDTLIVHDTLWQITERQLIVLLPTTDTTDDSNSTGGTGVEDAIGANGGYGNSRGGNGDGNGRSSDGSALTLRISILPDGRLMLSGLTAGKAYAIYTAAGKLVIRDTAPATGTALLHALPPGPYLLYHATHWSKFTHK